jgi:hypothetical protein
MGNSSKYECAREPRLSRTKFTNRMCLHISRPRLVSLRMLGSMYRRGQKRLFLTEKVVEHQEKGTFRAGGERGT